MVIAAASWRPPSAAAVAALLVLLTGCGPGPAANNPAIPQTTGTQLTDSDMPRPKPGLWQVTSAYSENRQLCLSGQVLAAFVARPGCDQITRQRTADGGIAMNSTCHLAGGQVDYANVSASGDFATAFTVNLQLGSSGGGAPTVAEVDQQQYRYMGACPPGRPPDDQPHG